ncbi:MAG: hypothetical protein ACI9KE_005170, partial [Polyangiales bacterium]
MLKRIAALAGATCLVGLGSANAQTAVCVEVEVRSWAELDSESDVEQDFAEEELAEEELAEEELAEEELAEEELAEDVETNGEANGSDDEAGAVVALPVIQARPPQQNATQQTARQQATLRAARQ